METEKRILDLDIETLAAGFADPDWVPQKITCVAWSWIGEDEVRCEISGREGFFSTEPRRRMLAPLLEAISEADMLTGHNLIRFDLPVLNAECLRLELPPVRRALVQDTMKLLRTKGFKKGQDNIGGLLRTKEQKMSLDWQEWQDAYEEPDWATIKERCISDVRMHKEMREGMLERRWLRPPTMWRA